MIDEEQFQTPKQAYSQYHSQTVRIESHLTDLKLVQSFTNKKLALLNY